MSSNCQFASMLSNPRWMISVALYLNAEASRARLGAPAACRPVRRQLAGPKRRLAAAAPAGWQPALLGVPSNRVQVLSDPVIADARQADVFPHFVQAAAQAVADALLQLVGEIRREDRDPPVVVAAVDDVGEDKSGKGRVAEKGRSP